MTIFGRIDIQFPDGRSESHLLGDDAITLGSAADNSIRILGAGLAERQLRITRRGDAAYLTNLSAEPHMAIDGVPVPNNDPQMLSVFAQIQIGELSIIFNRSSDSSTVAMDAVSDRTQPTARGFRAELESGVINVWALLKRYDKAQHYESHRRHCAVQRRYRWIASQLDDSPAIGFLRQWRRHPRDNAPYRASSTGGHCARRVPAVHFPNSIGAG